jgi:hypothetical protein
MWLPNGDLHRWGCFILSQNDGGKQSTGRPLARGCMGDAEFRARRFQTRIRGGLLILRPQMSERTEIRRCREIATGPAVDTYLRSIFQAVSR